MSLQSICLNVVDDLGIDIPATPLWGSKQPTARRVIAQARRAHWELLRRTAWAATVVEHEFTANGQSNYPFPPDFYKIINDTVWERTRYWQMRGALSPQQWQLYRSSIYGRATLWRRWRVRVPEGQAVGSAAVFEVDPRVAATDTTSKFVYEYQSAWAIRQGGSGTMVPDWTGDSDVSLLDESLVELGTRWRMARRIGLAYDEEKDEYERAVDRQVARDGGTASLSLVPWSRWDDWIGQYTLAAFPPVGPGSGQSPAGPAGSSSSLGPLPQLPPEVAAAIARYELPLAPSETGTEEIRRAVLERTLAAEMVHPGPGMPRPRPLAEPPAVTTPQIVMPGLPMVGTMPAQGLGPGGEPGPVAAYAYVVPETGAASGVFNAPAAPVARATDEGAEAVREAWQQAALEQAERLRQAEVVRPGPEMPAPRPYAERPEDRPPRIVIPGVPMEGVEPAKEWPPGTLGL
jgi:hypothetical protein